MTKWYDEARVAKKYSVTLAEWNATKSPSAIKKQTAQRRFDAAQSSRLNFGWNTSGTKLDAELRSDIVPLRARARDLSINNEYARKFLQMVATNMVGPSGFSLQSQAKKPNGEADSADRNAVENAFYQWSQVGECETSSKMSFADFCRLYARTAARDGEVLVRRIRDKKFTFGYRLQMLDIDRLDTLHNATLDNGNIIRMGVELDSYGAPQAYWLLSRHPGEYMAQTSGVATRERIPAREIFHCFVPERPEQTRGFTWMAAGMMSINMLGGYKEAAMVAARTGASKMGFFVSPDGNAGPLADGQDAEGSFTSTAEAGSFDVIPQGYDFKQYNPEYPTQNYEAFFKSCLRGVAVGWGVAYNSLGNDLENVNFSSIRSGTLEERENWMVLQSWMIETFLRPMFMDWLESALLQGAITAPTGLPLPAGKLAKFAEHNWQGRRWQWVDPMKDIEAGRLAVKSGISSPQIIAAQQGVDIDDVIQSIAEFERKIKVANITMVSYDDNPAPETAPPPPDPAADPINKALAALIARSAEPAPAPVTTPTVIHNHPPAITINTPDVRATINMPPAAAPVVSVTNEIIERDQAVPVVNVAAPIVNIAPAEITVEAIMPSQSEISIIAMPDRKTVTEITRDQNDDIKQSTQIETDA